MDWVIERLPWLWVGTVVLGATAVNLLWAGVVVLRAADVGYDPHACANRRPKVDLAKAKVRRHSWLRIALPLFLVALALFAAQLVWMSWLTYTLISIGWFVTTPLRKVWGIAVARRVAGDPVGWWRHVREYYGLGLRFPRRPEEEVWFIGRLRWLNRFQNTWYLLQFYRFWGILAQAVDALLWPVVCVAAIFYHLDGVGRPGYRLPWWRLDRDAGRQRPSGGGRRNQVAPA